MPWLPVTGSPDTPLKHQAPKCPHPHACPVQEVFNLARCKAALPIARLRKVGVPMPPDMIEALESGVEWEEFKVGAPAVRQSCT